MAVVCCLGQQQDSTMVERLENTRKNWNEGLASPLNGKKFEGNADLKIKSSTESSSSYSPGGKKYGAGSYTTRNFFGLKNPWFGKKVMKTEEASLWSKSVVPNGNKKFATDTAVTPQFYQANKTDQGTNHIVDKKTFIPKGKTQAALDEVKPKLTIDEVREILNKNR